MTKLGTTGGAAEDISIVYCIDISGSMSGVRLNAVKETILSQI
jgi:Mg-chelatase subunit ChlD